MSDVSKTSDISYRQKQNFYSPEFNFKLYLNFSKVQLLLVHLGFTKGLTLIFKLNFGKVRTPNLKIGIIDLVTLIINRIQVAIKKQGSSHLIMKTTSLNSKVSPNTVVTLNK
jgi:hypothetical protein